MLSHTDTFYILIPSRSLLFLLNAACLAQNQQIKYQLYGLWFNLQTVQVEDGDLESAIQITELVRSC